MRDGDRNGATAATLLIDWHAAPVQAGFGYDFLKATPQRGQRACVAAVAHSAGRSAARHTARARADGGGASRDGGNQRVCHGFRLPIGADMADGRGRGDLPGCGLWRARYGRRKIRAECNKLSERVVFCISRERE